MFSITPTDNGQLNSKPDEQIGGSKINYVKIYLFIMFKGYTLIIGSTGRVNLLAIFCNCLIIALILSLCFCNCVFVYMVSLRVALGSISSISRVRLLRDC